MKKSILILSCFFLICCKNEPEKGLNTKDVNAVDSTGIVDKISDAITSDPVRFSVDRANKLAALPLKCIDKEYPNKLGQVIGSANDLAEPHELHPAFYGCFNWHSAVHAHWSLVKLLSEFPDLNQAGDIRNVLKNSLSKENIAGEMAYFQKEINKSYERTYGWAWMLKLAAALHQWDDPLARELENNLQPLTKLIEAKFEKFLPKLNYPIRVGEHSNTAFALVLAYDYAEATENLKFKELIKKTATDFYLNDDHCPLSWEPSGFDFLSPCLSEIDIMRRVLPENAFKLWMNDFLPQLKKEDFQLEVGKVSDRNDGKLVYLDRLNFSRAWVLYGLAHQYPKDYSHLKTIAQKHLQYSLPNVMSDTYEGGHWLGSFAIYALSAAENNQQP